ncbi:MAG: serine/threonine protein kinase [Thermoguttaceae bacterium]|nr:serine/threonine protein kinase [Thermoguttaceae bacterium]MBR0190770.1 serine/threonine protein kinase [Thermoguttaceae bacterium]
MDTIDNSQTIDSDFQPSAAELKEGQFLGENQNYRLEKYLGGGGMGEVWLAAEIRGGVEIRKVVVKTLRPDRRGHEGTQAKTLEKFRLIQSLNHQNVCPIYLIERDPTCGYLIVMGYANGGSYADWFKNQPKENGGVPLQTICDVLRPIADALDYVHENGIIHRDVKPGNMMFTGSKDKLTSWLIDFDIAANLHTETQATQNQYSFSGTNKYMAPEQKNGELQTAQTDEYSLALVALEFLTGTTFIQATQILPLEIQRIMNKALALKSSNRFPTCRAFINALASAKAMHSAFQEPKTKPISDDAIPQSAIEQLVESERIAAEKALPQKIKTLEDLVTNEYQSGNYADAVAHLNELLELKPNQRNYQMLRKTCIEKLEIQRKEEARTRNIHWLENSIKMEMKCFQYGDAITHLKELLQLKPGDEDLISQLEKCKANEKKLEKGCTWGCLIIVALIAGLYLMVFLAWLFDPHF